MAEAGGVVISGCRIVGLQPLKVGNFDTADVEAPGTIRDFGSTNPTIEGNYKVLP